MIKVIYNRDMPRVTIEGHAGSGEAGHDLVCASVSILAYTLCSLVLNLGEGGYANNVVTDMKEGYADISCEPNKDVESSIGFAFASICAGFRILEHKYPENISFEIIEK